MTTKPYLSEHDARMMATYIAKIDKLTASYEKQQRLVERTTRRIKGTLADARLVQDSSLVAVLRDLSRDRKALQTQTNKLHRIETNLTAVKLRFNCIREDYVLDQ